MTLIDKEHHLPNDIGASGFVDILARDVVGNRVLIELKRSDVAARQALHELCKYIGLIKKQYGIPQHRLRCFVVSTHWHELRVPFAEFVRISDLQTEGFMLTVAPDGSQLSARQVKLPDAPEDAGLFLHHDILLYFDAKSRDAAAVPLAEQLVAEGAGSAFVCRLDASDLEQVMYPHALYVVAGGLYPGVRMAVEKRLRKRGVISGRGAIDPRLVQAEFCSGVVNKLTFDSREAGGPVTLAANLRGSWRCVDIIRRGRMASEAAATDEELLADFQGLNGTNSTVYERMATPRIAQNWADFRRSARESLRGNPTWERDFRLFCDLIERDHPTSMVSGRIYNPLLLPLSTYKLLVEGNPRFWPTMEVVASDSTGTITLQSYLGWTGKPCVGSVAQLFSGLLDGQSFDYFVLYALGGAWEIDEELRKRMGLEYVSVVTNAAADRSTREFSMVRTSGRVSLAEYIQSTERPLAQYLVANKGFLKEVCDLVASSARGM